jgi:hypothetical protein
MSKTLRKLVEGWTNDWMKQHAKGLQTESLEMYIAHKTIEYFKLQKELL